MKIYLVETNGNNMVVFTEGETAKCYDCAPTGMFADVDIYSDSAELDLTKYFAESDFLKLVSYYDLYSSNEIMYEDFMEEECEKIIVWDGEVNNA